MKDLKHLYEFEKLLESANNALVQQACAEGKHALAYTCYHMPEVLLNTGDCFSVRLRAPLTGSLDISSYYMSNFICDYCKSLLERGIEGGYNFLSGLMGTETCSEMNRARALRAAAARGQRAVFRDLSRHALQGHGKHRAPLR